MFQIFVVRKYDRALMRSDDVLRQIAPFLSGEIANVTASFCSLIGRSTIESR
jgi:hypothetical protein